MLPTNFKIAMFNHFGSGPFRDPAYCVPGTSGDWLIVERMGKVLLISDGNIPSERAEAENGIPAPNGLCANMTAVAHHIQTDRERHEASFLLSALAPLHALREGLFFPSCGVVRLRLQDGLFSLAGQGRHDFWSDFEDETRGVLTSAGIFERSALGDQCRSRSRWSLRAKQRPWASQMVETRSRRERS